MNLSLGSYSKELSTIRTGRANPKMLDGVRVEVYGQKMPISQLATVSVPEAQMINGHTLVVDGGFAVSG